MSVPSNTVESVTYPLSHATVLRILESEGTPALEKLTPSERFAVGKTVKLREDSRFTALFPNKEEYGRVLGLDEERRGWAYVRFQPSGFTQTYRIGEADIEDGTCDLDLIERFAVVNLGGQICEFPISELPVDPGDIVKIDLSSKRVVKTEKGVQSGAVAFVNSIIDSNYVMVDCDGGKKVVSSGKFSGKLEVSGRVVLDSTCSVIITNLGLEDDSFSVENEVNVSWDDICGQEDAKQHLLTALVKPALFPAHFKFFKKKMPVGVLMHGPPGCSKTLFGKAIFTAVTSACKERGINSSRGFILINGPEILDKYVGVAEATIRHLFARARKFYKETGMRAVIFMEECEALLAKRDSGISSDVLRTVVPAFLAEMQGIRESGALVVLATNKPELLDYAAIREGRIDEKIEIGRPDKVAARQIFLKNMKDIPVSETTTLDQLADCFVEELFSSDRVIYEITKNEGGEDKKVSFTLANIVSGAMIPVAIEGAKRLALERELAKEVPTEGLRIENVVAGVENIFQQNLVFDHTEALRDFVKDFAEQVRLVNKKVQVRG